MNHYALYHHIKYTRIFPEVILVKFMINCATEHIAPPTKNAFAYAAKISDISPTFSYR